MVDIKSHLTRLLYWCHAVGVVIATASADTYEWTAGGDGKSVFQAANWTLVGGTNTIPQISASSNLQHDLLVNSGTPGGNGGFGPHL